MAQHIFPSIMAKSQQELDAMLNNLKGAAKVIHLDIADGKFVPNTSLWFKFKLSSHFRYTAHLMIEHPKRWIIKYGKKVDLCIVQWETIKDKKKFIAWMKRKKQKIAFALKPETKVKPLMSFLKDIDYILILTVHPGFYGGRYLRAPLAKIKLIKKINPRIKIIVDGGMNPIRVQAAARAGADYCVSGSFITKVAKPKERMRLMEKNFWKA